MFKKNSITQGDSLELLKKIPDKSIDLIFADPPYGKIDIYKLKEICFSSLLNNGRFILESSKNDRIPEGGITKHYGDTVVTFWTNSS